MLLNRLKESHGIEAFGFAHLSLALGWPEKNGC